MKNAIITTACALLFLLSFSSTGFAKAATPWAGGWETECRPHTQMPGAPVLCTCVLDISHPTGPYCKVCKPSVLNPTQVCRGLGPGWYCGMPDGEGNTGGGSKNQ